MATIKIRGGVFSSLPTLNVRELGVTLDAGSEKLYVGTATGNKLLASADSLSGTLTSGRIPFATGTRTLSDDAALFWNNTYKRLGIGTTNPLSNLHIAATNDDFAALDLNNNYTSGLATTSMHIGYNRAAYYGYRIVNTNNPSSQAAGLFKIQRGTTSSWLDDFVIDNIGNVGIGTTSIGAKLDIWGNLRLSYDSSNYASMKTDSAGSIYFGPKNGKTYFNGSGVNNQFYAYDYSVSVPYPYLALSAHSLSLNNGGNTNYGTVLFSDTIGGNSYINSGNVGIGTTAPESKFTVSLSGQAVSTNFLSGTRPLSLLSGSGQSIISGIAMASNTDSERAILQFRRARGTVVSPLAVQADDILASFSSGGYDGESTIFSSQIDFIVDGAVTTTDVPQRISFVTGTTAGNRTERMVIKSTGNVGIGYSTGTEITNNKLAVNGSLFANGAVTGTSYKIGTRQMV